MIRADRAPSAIGPRAVVAAVGLVALLALGCTHSYSYLLTADGEVAADSFPTLRAAATRSVSATPGGFELQVRYPPGFGEEAAELLELLRAPVGFLQRATGRTRPGRATFYLAGWPAGEKRPHVEPRGPGVVTGVFFVRPEQDLLEVEWNRTGYYGTVPHELAHHFLSDLSGVDRWLSDGLPEHLAAEFARGRSEAAALASSAWTPPVVALHRVELEPWTHEHHRRVETVRAEDPDRAMLLGWEEVWRYAAAQELVERWLRAAGSRGVDEPVRDLLRRVGWSNARTLEDLRAVAHDQTGRTLEELARVTAGQRASAVREAWQLLTHPDLKVRTHALRTVEFFGFPQGGDPSVLLDAAPPATREDAGDWYFWQALGGAVAATGEETAARRYVRLARERFSAEEARRRVPPAVWRSLLPVDRAEALAELAATVNDRLVPLPLRRHANATLEEATGTTVGWRVDAPPEERAEAAAQWREVVAGEPEAAVAPRSPPASLLH